MARRYTFNRMKELKYSWYDFAINEEMPLHLRYHAARLLQLTKGM